MNDTIKKIDLKLKDDVLAELKHESIVKVVGISILAKNDAVTLK